MRLPRVPSIRTSSPFIPTCRITSGRRRATASLKVATVARPGGRPSEACDFATVGPLQLICAIRGFRPLGGSGTWTSPYARSCGIRTVPARRRRPVGGNPHRIAGTKGSLAAVVASHTAEPGVFYAAINSAVYRSDEAGRSWQSLPIDWPAEFTARAFTQWQKHQNRWLRRL